MKIVGVISSPHADGNGAALVREALRGAQEAGASVTEVFLRNYSIEYCSDCRVCIHSGRCVVDDDFQEVRDLLCDADGIILSSPTYGGAICARMKNLLDRLGQYAFLTSTFGGKYVIGIATASSFAAKKVAGQLAASIRDGMFRRAFVCGTLAVRLRGQHVRTMPRVLLQARTLGSKMVADLRNGRRFPLQNLLGRFPKALFLRPLIKQGILKNKEAMKGVYEELVRRELIARAEG